VDCCNNLFHVAFLLWVTVVGVFVLKALILLCFRIFCG
jgi:hypothetical protein